MADRVEVLGTSVDLTGGGGPPNWTDSGPSGNRNNLDPSVSERIPTRAINRIYELVSTLEGTVDLFDDRLTNLVGEVPGADQAAFDGLGGNLIQTLAAGGGGSTDDGVY